MDPDSKIADSKIAWNKIEIPSDMIENWQKIVNVLAKIFNVPAALIMRVHPPTIEVFISSHTEENPYEKGEEAKLAGLYCTTVIQSQKQLLVPDALKDPVWDHNPDIELGMVSYLGMPIKWSNGDTFGTICVLDKKENSYSELYVETLSQFKEMVENQLNLIMKNQEILKINKEIDEFKKILPKCSYCENVRLPDETWVSIEEYLLKKQSTAVSHSICPDCTKIHFPDLDET
uniref:GAF domain protein n=1 Tax=Promethearchaeum syntrophicum TaxID=2594042 RepID=A0A5B9DA35_9ARCH|nr:GAF domain-containing protein [Candidatus Prometheoarchaeum syntrophicum]QEE16128.1 GAF domain protein [Candidatus Prometheoarchaeum syntrophicum]